MKSIAQIRAQYALAKVDEIKTNFNKLNNKNYKSFVAGCPTMILQNGLGQALAFWAAKSKLNLGKKEGQILEAPNDDQYYMVTIVNLGKKEGQILEVIREWFGRPENPLKLESIDCKDFIQKLMQKNQNEFILFQKETLLMLEWYKRYVNAFLDDTEAATNGED